MKILPCLAVTQAVFASTSAYACSCRDVPRTIEQHVDQSDVIFLGRAVGVHRVVIWSEGFETYHSTRFLIREALKGIDSDAATDAPQYVYVRHPGGDPAACGVSFDNGVEYRIFANLYKDKIYTSLCSFSTNAADPDNAPWEDYRRAAGMADALAKEQP